MRYLHDGIEKINGDRICATFKCFCRSNEPIQRSLSFRELQNHAALVDMTLRNANIENGSLIAIMAPTDFYLLPVIVGYVFDVRTPQTWHIYKFLLF